MISLERCGLYFLRKKFDAFVEFKVLEAAVENEVGKTIKVLQ
jgi:hypothetical protein